MSYESSNSQIARGELPNLEGELLIAKPAEAYKLKEGDNLSSLSNAIPGEKPNTPGIVTLEQFGPIKFSFQPPGLQATFSITDFQVSFPPLELVLKALGIKEVFSAEIEIGWLFQITYGGFIYFSETVLAEVGTYENTEASVIVAKALRSQVRTIQVYPTLEVAPGTLVTVLIIPFFFVRKVTKTTKFNRIELSTTNTEGTEPIFQPSYARMIYQLVRRKGRRPIATRTG